ncbi:HAD family hydrolase [Draconibacterium sediminis]|uniref:ABC transporter ATP-binding protein n=1 Tax=Draconibacterium sediminis TaxID=1544798 RepID=A0A0D8JCD3_9BACT|nr:HAD family phosphatase [Draconibacterium sediminis]KJF43458.1 hypothetical protein LH29_14635 [Draconibacterium sediminis]
MIAALIFDMDGVIFNSEDIIAKAGVEFFKKRNIVVDKKEFTPFIGTGEFNYLNGVAENYNFKIATKDKLELYKIYKKIAKEELSIYKGIIEIINKSKKQNVKIALATSADMSKVEINFGIVNYDYKIFDIITTGTEIKNKKPHPEIFQITCSNLNIKPENSIVIEDSPMGICAAKKAGCKCFAITNTFDTHYLTDADAIYSNYDLLMKEIFKQTKNER